MLTSRELPPEEWPKLAGTDLAAWLPLMEPDRFSVIVVENEKAEIVGSWAFLLVFHAEGFWIAPAYRRGSVARILLRKGWELMRRLGAQTFVTGAASDEMRGYLTRIGGQELPTTFAVSLAGPLARLTTKEKTLCR